MARYTFEGVQSGDICLYGSKHMRLPTQIHSLAHRHPPATGTDCIPAMLSPPNTRPRASTGAKPHPSHARTPQPCHLRSSLLPHPSSLRATTTPLTRTFVSPLPRPCPAAASLGTAGLHGHPKFQPCVRRKARRSPSVKGAWTWNNPSARDGEGDLRLASPSRSPSRSNGIFLHLNHLLSTQVLGVKRYTRGLSRPANPFSRGSWTRSPRRQPCKPADSPGKPSERLASLS